MLEKDIERKVCEHAKERGVLGMKFNSMGRAAVPDRIFIYSGKVLFIEFKRLGCVPTPAQLREHDRLRQYGVPVFVIDNVQDGKRLIDAFCG